MTRVICYQFYTNTFLRFLYKISMNLKIVITGIQVSGKGGIVKSFSIPH